MEGRTLERMSSEHDFWGEIFAAFKENGTSEGVCKVTPTAQSHVTQRPEPMYLTGRSRLKSCYYMQMIASFDYRLRLWRP